jgi:hypothetical protein
MPRIDWGRVVAAIALPIALAAAAALTFLPALIILATKATAFPSTRYAQDVPEHIRSWFQSVRSPRGVPCCDIADGHRTTWRAGATGYEVPIENVWTPVPPEAVVYNAGNPLDEAVVWYVRQGDSSYYIRCFVPGDGV